MCFVTTLKAREDSRITYILDVTLFLYLLREVYLTDMQRILMNFAQTFCSTANTMKLLFAISVVSVCLFLVTARFVHFIHRQEIEEELNARDDNEVTGFFDMPSRSSSKIHIASCLPRGARCRRDSDCCSFTCMITRCVSFNQMWRLIPCENHKGRHKWHLIESINKKEGELEIYNGTYDSSNRDI